MKFPNLSEEKKLWKQGFNCVAGLDEAGRGPLAGPVTAAAVCINPNFKNKNIFKGINDSKKLSAQQREYFYKILTAHPGISWGVGIVSEKVIDQINILQATKLAMSQALENLKPDYLLIDGNFTLKNLNIFQKAIISGDAKVFSICAAGIIAKVTRDQIMKEMDKKFPQYDFKRHKGYGTRQHLENIKKFGPCQIHRKTFYPISAI